MNANADTPQAKKPAPPSRFDWWGRLKYFFYHSILHADDTPQSLALAFGIGMFVAFTPTIGLQMVISGLIAWILRINKPVAIAVVWISNPITTVPIFVPCYLLGALLMGQPVGYEQAYFQIKDIFVPESLIQIVQLPEKGTLTLNNKPVKVSQTITISRLNRNQLVFKPDRPGEQASPSILKVRIRNKTLFAPDQVPITIPPTANRQYLLTTEQFPFQDISQLPLGNWWDNVKHGWSAMLSILTPLWLGSLIVAAILGVLSYFIMLWLVIHHRLKIYGQLEVPDTAFQTTDHHTNTPPDAS